MLTVDHLSAAIGKKELLRDISAAFAPGRCHLIIGPNGAGKSSLIKALCGRLSNVSGDVRYGGKSIREIPAAQQARIRAVLSQHSELVFPLLVQEVVMMGRYPHFTGVPAVRDTEACRQAMAFADVLDLADRNYQTLSGGEKQRVQFARAIAQIGYPQPGQARYLLLDEPLTFLDVYYQHRLMQQLHELLQQQDLIVVGVVHDLNLAARFADQLLLLHQGRLLASGTVEDVLTPEHILAAYRLEPLISRGDKGISISF